MVISDIHVEQNAAFVQDLKGHSGCKVQLARVGENYIVRKTSAAISYNDRLLRQIDKQKRLQTIVPVARVIATGLQNGLVSFDMEYINGRDLRTQCIEEPASWVFRFTDRLFETIQIFAGTGSGEIPTINFITKYDELVIKIHSHPLFSAVENVLSTALRRLSTADWSSVPRTECHGDLSLENIIFRSDSSIIYIDVLDGDLESFWLDIAKLLFDLEIGWSLRHVIWNVSEENAQEARLLKMLTRYLREDVQARIEAAYPLLASRISQFKALQALRIIPYTHDKLTFDRLVVYLNSINAQSESFR